MSTASSTLELSRVSPSSGFVRTIPGARTGLLVWDMTGAEALERFQRSPADFLGPDCALLDTATLAQAAKERVPLLPWTVNDPAMMRTLFNAAAVTGIITDHLVEALHLRRAMGCTDDQARGA